MACGGLPIGATTFRFTETTADSTTGLNLGTAVPGKAYRITDMVISTDTEMTITVKETDNDIIIEEMYFPATSIWSKTWCTPITLMAGEYLVVYGSLAGNVTVTITGYLK